LRKDLKRQIKEDELVTGFERLAGLVQANQTAVQNGALAVALLVAAAWGYSAWTQRRTLQAEAAFAEALSIFEAPLRSELPKEAQLPATLQVFDDAGEKYKKAAAAFDGVERRCGGHPGALRARYFGALSRAEAGDTAEARKQLESVAEKAPPLESALAKLALAEQLRKSDPARAAEAFSKLANDPGWPLPKDHALMSLAETQELAKKTAEARATYKRLAEEFPASVYASEARRRAEDLGSSD
jgi:tetratricopeptide (TPR) repeat protein